ncbi:MAG: hypothetical protein JOY68_08330 [Candidatus Dormibacteraeota bacterium]|nr:hypothetical protein [Candidatus Dormibacteraeota bacterium]
MAPTPPPGAEDEPSGRAQSPAEPPALEQFAALPLPDADWPALPPAPPPAALIAPPELVAPAPHELLPELLLEVHFAEPSLPDSAPDQASPPLLSSFCDCFTDPSAELSLPAVVSDVALDEPDVADSDPPPEPLLDALLLLEVSPPVASAVLPLAALPLPSAFWLELPPAPPVAPLVADPEFHALAVELLLSSPLLLELEFALPSL